MKQETLSDKRKFLRRNEDGSVSCPYYYEEDVKEAVKKLKDMLKENSGSEYGRLWDKLNEIFGEKLT